MNSKMKKVINGMLVSTMVFSMVGVVFADNQLDVVKEESFTKPRMGIEQRQDKFKSILDQIIEKEILTQEQTDYISKKLSENREQRHKLTLEEKKSKLEEKITNGEITHEKANELLERMESKGGGEKFSRGRKEAGNKEAGNKEARERLTSEKRKSKLEEKIASGEIAREKADDILKKMESIKTNRESRLKAVFSEFVENEIITQNQLDDILELLK